MIISSIRWGIPIDLIVRRPPSLNLSDFSKQKTEAVINSTSAPQIEHKPQITEQKSNSSQGQVAQSQNNKPIITQSSNNSSSKASTLLKNQAAKTFAFLMYAPTDQTTKAIEQQTPPTPPSPPPSQATTQTRFSENLPFDPSTLSPGEAYAKLVRLENDENLITLREQKLATEVLNTPIYKQIPLAGSNNIVFLFNPMMNVHNEAKAIREVEIMSQMPAFKGLFDYLKNSGQKVVIMLSSYGKDYAASNVNLVDAKGQKINIITLDPDYIDYDHNNLAKRNVLTALSNELHEIVSRVEESKQNLSYVATRPFQESTLAIDQLMENFIKDFARSNNLNYGELNAQERSDILSLMRRWSTQTLLLNLSSTLNEAHQLGSYGKFPPINNYSAAISGVNSLNKKLDYLLGADRQVQFTVQRDSLGAYYFVPGVLIS